MKKTISILLTIIMLFCITTYMQLSASAVTFDSATYTDEYGEWTYISSNNINTRYTLLKYNGNKTDIVIPNKINNIPVSSISLSAFKGCSNLTSITIQSNVASLSSQVFVECSSLISVNVLPGNKSFSSIDGVLFNKTQSELIYYPIGKLSDTYVIPDSVTTINNYAFPHHNNLTSIIIPDTVTTIPHYAFTCCDNLKNITIPDSVTSIGMQAFYNCSSLTSISIPYNVASIGLQAFYNCSNLNSINVSPDNNFFSSINGVLFNKTQSELICYPIGKSSDSYVIPNTVTNIKDSAFYNSKYLTNITMSNSVTTIERCVFEGCSNITSIILSDNLISLPDYTFAYCNKLTSITIPNSVTSINYGVFSGCNNLTDVIIQSNVAYIALDAFHYCRSLTNIDVSEDNNVYSSIDGILFNKSQSELIFYPTGKLYDSYVIPNSVTTINLCAFFKCDNLSSVTIPNSVTSIESETFVGCTSLTNIIIPNSITSIKFCAFLECDNITDIYFTGSESEWNSILIEEYNDELKNATIHYNYVQPIYGDITGDGTLSINDIIYLLKSLVYDTELTDEQIKLSDLSGDGKLTVLDAILIQKLVLEMI